MARKHFTCCLCGSPADDNIDVDGTGRVACSKAHADLLLGRNLPEKDRKGWYCVTHRER